MDRQQIDNHPLFIQACEHLSIDQEQLRFVSLEDFVQARVSKYNFNEEAWKTLWEAEEEKKLTQLYSIVQFIRQKQQEIERHQQESYDALLQQVVNSAVIRKEKNKFAQLKAGQLRDLRFYVEQQMAELKGKKSHVPRYRPVESEVLPPPYVPQTESDRDGLGKKIKWNQELSKLKMIDPSKVIVGIDKLAPKIVKDTQFEQDVDGFDPGDSIYSDLDIDVDTFLAAQDIPPEKKVTAQNRIELVQQRQRQIMDEKREKLLQKEQRAAEKLDIRMQRQRRQQYEKIINNTLDQQDKQENLKRKQIVYEYNREKLEKRIEAKKQRVEQFQDEQRKKKELVAKINANIENYEQVLQKKVDQFEMGRAELTEIEALLDANPVPHKYKKVKAPKEIPQTAASKPRVKSPRSQKLEKQMVDLEEKHNLEMRVLIEREQLAELNRQKKMKEKPGEELEPLFEKQRIASRKRIQSLLNKQTLEMKHLMGLYKKK